MSGYLFAEEGPLIGLTIKMEEGDEWVIGRDPEVATFALEDPMVSRKHVLCSESEQGITIENLSATNPASVNGQPITEPILLNDGDVVQIGHTYFRFSYTGEKKEPQGEEDFEGSPTLFEGDEENLSAFSLTEDLHARFVIKVISGPNSGAEFGIQVGSTYVLGKDPSTCDIVFHDLSVSRQHAQITAEQSGVVFIEDLNSKNGVLVNGLPIQEKQELLSQDLIALGTTTFLIIDREKAQETIISPPSHYEAEAEEEKEEVKVEEQPVEAKTWKQMIIPIKHLIFAGIFGVFVLVAIFGVISLFKGKEVEISYKDQSEKIDHILKEFPSIEYSYNPSSGTLFIRGHVLTEVGHQELVYLLHALPFVQTIEDNVIIDELVWQNFNALLMKNPDWRGVSVTSSEPGKFVLRGYVKNNNIATELMEYVNVNFSHLDQLKNQVVVENTLQAEIQSILIDKGFVNVTFQLSGGELVLAGRVNSAQEHAFETTITKLKKIPGIYSIKNFVIFTSQSTGTIDISKKYKVTGTSKVGGISQYVVINGKILTKGDTFEGMIITEIDQNSVFLEKDGLKYKINYNLQ